MIFKPEDKAAFCVIAPTAYLEQFATKSNTHLVLAHLVEKDATYASFYARRRLAGDRIIMDNGAFELGQSYDPSKLIDLGHACGAHAIVLPDYPFQPASVTIKAAEEHGPKIRDAGFETMYVPQSETGDVADWIRGYRWAGDEAYDMIDIIGMSILGIPNAWNYVPAAYARVVATEVLLRTHSFQRQFYHHYLGLNAGPALEIPSLIKMGVLNSCDSSNPVWAGICGHEYSLNTDSYLAVSKMKKHVDFSYPMVKDKNTLRIIERNVELTLELFE